MSTTPPVAPAAGEQRPITPVEDWSAALRQRRLPRFDPAAHDHLVVLAAHPDDETLGAGGLLRVAHRAGVRVTLVVATDGEAAYPALGAAGRVALAEARRAELHTALARAGLDGMSVHRLGLPDSGLAGHADELTAALAPFLAAADAYLAPWAGDPHPDHRAVGMAAAAAAPVTTHGWSYPIWMWAWMTPGDPAVRWDRAHLLPLDPADRVAKQAAIACFTSQVDRSPDGSPPVLSPAMLAHTQRDAELFFREPPAGSAPVGRFAELYAGGADPWEVNSWYERRKRAVVLACLPRERYRVAFEPGCGTGELTLALADRCDRVLASDPVAEAAARARATTAMHPGVVVTRVALPDAAPRGRIDLAVFSEVLYYLDDDTIRSALDRTVDVLEPGGDLVVVHWRGWPAEAPRDAAATHRMVRAHPALDEVVEHIDEQFVLHVLRRR